MLSLFGFLSETRNIFSLLNCLRPYRGCWLRSTTLAKVALSASSASSLGTRFQQLTDEHIISDLVSSSQLSCSAQTQPYHIFLISCPLSCFFLAATPLSSTLVTLLVCRVGWRGACLLVHTLLAFSKYKIFQTVQGSSLFTTCEIFHFHRHSTCPVCRQTLGLEEEGEIVGHEEEEDEMRWIQARTERTRQRLTNAN